MAKDNSKFVKGIEIKESDVLLNKSLEITVDSGATSDTKTTLKAAQSSNVTVTLPNATDTLVGRATTDTLTNKSIDDDNNAITNLALTGIKTVLGQANNFLSRDVTGAVIDTKAVPTGAVVGTSDTQTLTNKTIDGSSSGTNTIQNTAFDVEYDNSGSTLTATHVNDAVDQLDLKAEAATAGPASSTDNALVRFDGTTGKLVQNSGTTLDDSGNMIVQNKLTVLGDLQVDGTTTTVNTATLDVEDANITINKNGNQATADDVAGLTVEMTDATDVAIVYDKDVASRWKVGDVGSEAQIATVSHTQTLTNKTIAAGSNTITGLLHGTQVDNPSSGVHGVTGSVVGTSDAQDLSNKTFTNPVILEEQASSPSAPSSGDRKLYSKTDGKLYHKGSDGVERKVGSGSGASVNYHEDYDCDDISKVSVYDDGGVAPTDGAGGTTSVTATLETSAPLAGTGSYKLSKGASNLQGEGWAIDSSALDDMETVSGQMLWVDFSYKTSANFVADDVKVYVYRVGSNTLEALNTFQGSSMSNTLPVAPNGARYTGWVTCSSSDTSIRLILHCASTSALAYDIYMDRLSMGPSAQVQSGIMGGLEEVTGYTLSTGTGSISNATLTTFESRMGDQMLVIWSIAFTGTSTWSDLYLNMRSGRTIDVDKFTQVGSDAIPSAIRPLDTGVSGYGPGIFTLNSSTQLRFIQVGGGIFSSTSPFTFNSTDSLSGWFMVPISGWTSGNVMSTAELAVRSVKFEVGASGPQSIAHQASEGSEVKWTTWAAPNTDSHNGWDSTNSRYVFPQTGTYLFTAKTIKTAVTSGGAALMLKPFLNNTMWDPRFARLDTPVAAIAEATLTGTRIINVTQGDYLDIRIFQNSGGAIDFNSATLTITQLPDLTVVGVNGVNELVESSNGTLANYSITAGQWGELTSISLTPGTWDIEAHIAWYSNGATTLQNVGCGISTTSGNSTTGLVLADTLQYDKKSGNSGDRNTSLVSKRGVLVTSSTTYYLKAYADSPTTNLQAAYKISARRVQ